MSKIQFVDWGLIEYNEAWSKQEALFSKSVERKSEGLATDNFLVFCEHPHVYTLGKSGDEQNMLLNYIQLQTKNLSWSGSGGRISYFRFV